MRAFIKASSHQPRHLLATVSGLAALSLSAPALSHEAESPALEQRVASAEPDSLALAATLSVCSTPLAGIALGFGLPARRSRKSLAQPRAQELPRVG